MTEKSLMRTCMFCGAVDTRHLGSCTVCSRTVCEHCGNVSFAGGERRVTHNECLHKDGDSFSMIKFVK